MEAVWFAIVSGMLAVYTVLDGFDFGAGILHRFVARTDEERRTVFAAIGPVWDGNEVWLIAAGGVLFLAFPRVYSGAFTFSALAGHGALYLVWKTTGPVQARSRTWARRAWLAVLPLWALASLATARLRPETFTNLVARPWFLGFVVLMLAGVGGVFLFLRHGRELAAFLSSSSFLLGLLAATMAGIYPVLFRS